MKELSITDLAKILNVRVIGLRSAGQTCLAVSTDSRTVKTGDCFFAINGPNFDGHDFLADAFAKGASCAVVSKDVPPDKFPNKTVLCVNNTVEALGRLAASYRKNCSFKVVAITGSVGKTTTREIAYHVLSKRFKTFQSLKNFNNFIGLPISILTALPEHQILVLELATNKPGEIEYLARIAVPDIALITNVHPVHLAGLGTVEKIAEEKLSIVKGLRPDGILILNADCPSLLASASLVEAGLDPTRKAKLSFKTFACSTSADFFARNISIGPLLSSFAIDDVTVEIPLPGWGNVENTLAAWAICSSLGISIRDFADALKTISPVSMRTEMLQIGPSATGSAVGETSPKGGLTVISDCYNANPASMKNALDILATLAKKQQHRAVFICGDMAELGVQAEKFHVELGRLIAQTGVGLLLTVGNLASIAADAAKREKPGLQTHCFIDPAELCNNLHQLIKDSDIILVKGSRINKLEMVVEKLKELHNTK